MEKIYNTKSEWNSETKTEPTIGLIKQTGEVLYSGGINFCTTSPKIGDALYLDSDGKPKAITLESYAPASIPSGWTPVGSVYNVTGKEIWVVAKDGASKRWAAIRLWEVSGYNLDGTSHTATFTFCNSSSVQTQYPFTYSATTKEEFCNQLDTWLRENNPENYKPRAYIKDGYVYLAADNYAWWQQDSYTTCSGLTLTHWSTPISRIPAISRTPQNNTFKNIYCIVNKERIKQWGGRTPSSNVSLSEVNTPVSKNAFETSSYCDLIRNTYGDYDTYLDAVTAQHPASNGSVSWRNVGHAKTQEWCPFTYITSSGSEELLFTAANYANDYGISGSQYFAPGNWWVPDVDEIMYMMKNITYGLSGVSRANADPVNRCLYLMGGTGISCTAHRWSSVRCNSYFCWGYNSLGYLDSNLFDNSFMVSPVSRLLKSDLD